MTKEQLESLAQSAKSILQNPAYKIAMEIFQENMYRLWLDSKSQEGESRERLWRHIKAADSFRIILEQLLNNGKIGKSRALDNDAIQRAKDVNNY